VNPQLNPLFGNLGEADAGLPSSGTTTIPAYIRMAKG
jgi:hypothetical protein